MSVSVVSCALIQSILYYIQLLDPKPCIVIHHGGSWRQGKGGLKYEGGLINMCQDLPDNLDASYVKSIVAGLGYKNVIKLHYLDPKKSMKDGILYLGYDSTSFARFVSLVIEYGLVHVFCKHNMDAANESPIGWNDEINLIGTTGSFVNLLTGDDEAIYEMDDNEAMYVTQKSPMANVFEMGETDICDDGIDYDEEGGDMDYDEILTAREKIKEDEKREMELQEESAQLNRVSESKGMQDADMNSDYDCSSELESPGESSDEEDHGYLVSASKLKPIRPKSRS